eukprot:TRINITY_DN2655_c0_g1_i2.p1 TRINITY_DN2655_c0_g1~~TRINITY_DN2655_c0_g1_i2.p1  ORF type:complete len:755 (+),score=229.23 TRINITY_DN2655_c0_g1_i2:462-2726(+)
MEDVVSSTQNLTTVEGKEKKTEKTSLQLGVQTRQEEKKEGKEEEKILLNAGREILDLTVTSLCDRPIQIGSHFHFIEANPLLRFDRIRAYGKRLNIPSGTAVRFEPGESKTVSLVAIGGKKVITGGNGLATGPVDLKKVPAILDKIQKLGFLHLPQELSLLPSNQAKAKTVSRETYSSLYGPTVGDFVFLGDTNLVIEIEKDFTRYGDECTFGGGKVIREGMGQATGYPLSEVLDVVVTNVVVMDWTGIFKADVGVKNQKIKIGKSGNPDIMDDVSPGMVIGPTTEVIAGEGMVMTAGGIDTHIHFICPQQIKVAIASGITTMIGGGTGPCTGTNATTCTPGEFFLEMMMKATESFPMNFGFTGKGNTSAVEAGERPVGLVSQIVGGALGLKLHEDWGTTPEAIRCCLTVAEEYDVAVTIHTDTLNEAGCVEQTIGAFENRTIHTYHSEGAGGGHAPDIMRVVGQANVLPSSTNPTRPYTKNTIDEHLDMLMVCHHLDGKIPEDVAFAESRIRGETISAEDVLHDMGAISMMSSDSQAMGRVGEVITRTWQTAAKMKSQRGFLPDPSQSPSSSPSLQKERRNDNFRVRRYLAKYTINPAVAFGVSHLIGSIEEGKFADLVLWKPEFFGAKPQLVLKGGVVAWAQMGDANASIPTPQPMMMRPMFGAFGSAPALNSITFVSQISLDSGKVKSYGLNRRIEAVKGCTKLGKKDMRLNDLLPNITIDPETFEVKVDGVLLKCEPASSLPLAQRYFFF